ncbi:serine protease persephone-like [Trichoplusia ni]|uniref:Serine protease persephone-like n=1 Tax=Trichoplusia ni TaxID=7111 RepID=A0A7E5WUG2_TRINI|nr:serine protease persephone-like [Trichoplusia ni]
MHIQMSQSCPQYAKRRLCLSFNNNIIMLVFVIICGFLTVLVNSQERDCVNKYSGEKGKCKPLDKCQSAKHDQRYHIKPEFCTNNGTSDLKSQEVCCLQGDIISKLDSTLLSILGSDSLCLLFQPIHRDPEEPLKQGKKAWDMCIKYQEDFFSRRLNDSISIGTGGVFAQRGEFPHMALLGYGKIFSEAEFNCGGSLISERFVLTAAHCRYSAGLGYVTIAVFGIHYRNETAEEKYIYGVKKIIKHPMYKPPKKYNDIALLEMDRRVIFDFLVMPGCLHVGDRVDDGRAYGTGWGYLGQSMVLAQELQTIPLWKIANDTCRLKFAPYKRLLPDGIDDSSQMCYGDDGTPRDTCEGDSGGPLQIKSTSIYCMYVIIGVTSFGFTTCGEVGYPGVYTRVSNYVPWIESIVWP